MENSITGTEEGKAGAEAMVRTGSVSDGSGDGLSPMGRVIRVDEAKIQSHLEGVVRDTVEQTLNSLLDAEADRACGAKRYERNAARRDTRAGHYERKLHTRVGEVELKVPKLRKLPLETAIIERYRRRESSVEEAMIEMYLAGVGDLAQAMLVLVLLALAVSFFYSPVGKGFRFFQHDEAEAPGRGVNRKDTAGLDRGADHDVNEDEIEARSGEDSPLSNSRILRSVWRLRSMASVRGLPRSWISITLARRRTVRRAD